MNFPIDIRQFLPHRKPMLMVDDVLEMTEQEITTSFSIREDNIFIEASQLNEAGMIENAAQTCSGIVGRAQFEANQANEGFMLTGFISKIKRFEVMRCPSVNTSIQTKGRLVSKHSVGTMITCEVDCKTYQNDQQIASGVFQLILNK